MATHPQLLEWMGDENTQYDVIEGQNWNRQIVPQGVPSPAVADQLSEQDVLDSYYETRAYYQAGHGRDLSAGDDGTPQVPPGSSARAVLAQAQRETLSAQFGRSFDQWSDSELLDGIQYFLFPNFYAFAGPRTNAVYRFLPDGNDPDRCIAEVLAARPASGRRRAAAGAARRSAGCRRARRSRTSPRSACSGRCSTRTTRTCRTSRRA